MDVYTTLELLIELLLLSYTTLELLHQYINAVNN